MQLEHTFWYREQDERVYVLAIARGQSRKDHTVWLVPVLGAVDSSLQFRFPGSQIKTRVRLDGYGFVQVGGW